jgi:hypothetical protein
MPPVGENDLVRHHVLEPRQGSVVDAYTHEIAPAPEIEPGDRAIELHPLRPAFTYLRRRRPCMPPSTGSAMPVVALESGLAR